MLDFLMIDCVGSVGCFPAMSIVDPIVRGPFGVCFGLKRIERPLYWSGDGNTFMVELRNPCFNEARWVETRGAVFIRDGCDGGIVKVTATVYSGGSVANVNSVYVCSGTACACGSREFNVKGLGLVDVYSVVYSFETGEVVISGLQEEDL